MSNLRIHIQDTIEIENYSRKYYFSKELYNKEALLKAAYAFTDIAYIHLDLDEEYFIVNIEMKADDKHDGVCEKDFKNELLSQMVRQSVFRQTKNIRELMMARAFSSTILENPDYEGEVETEENFENVKQDILMDWFEKYE